MLSLTAQLVKNLPTMQETLVPFVSGRSPGERDRLPTAVFLGFPCGSAGKESAYIAGDLGLIPGLGRFPGEGKGYPLQCSGLENSTDCRGHGGYKESETTERVSLSLLIGNNIWKIWRWSGLHYTDTLKNTSYTRSSLTSDRC